MLLSYFNSIKVQLEPQYRCELSAPLGFQFHKGTIRTALSSAGAGAALGFQFHKGTIRTLLSQFCTIIEVYFNSIKVQLERYISF